MLFLAESFHPVLGGGEAHLRRLGSALVACGDAATVVTRRGEPSWPATDELDGVRVRRVPPTGAGRVGKYLMLPGALLAVAREAGRHDVLVVRGSRVLGLPALVAGRLAGLPVVLQPEINGELDGSAFTWGKGWALGGRGRLARAVVRSRNVFLRDAEAFVAMSSRIRDEMRGAGIAAERIALIRHGVDTVRFRPATREEAEALRARLGLPRETLAVYTGRLLEGKGLDVLLDAFTAVAAGDAALQLVLVGSGEGQSLSVEEALRRRAAETGLAGRVRFAGRVEAVEDWLRAADLFVFPSLFEGLGISLVEAAACGLPAIGSRTGGIVDVIEDGRSGLLVGPGDVAGLAGALRSLAADAGLRSELGRRARAVARERFDEADALARYRALFLEVSSRWPSSRPARAPRAGAGPLPSRGARA
ncbi:MAG: glycosyltransferase family 4 protein [Betaproteobacteria bacterium]